MYLLTGAGRIACKDARLFKAFSWLWPHSSTFYKLIYIDRLCYMERKELPRASRERSMSRMHDCPSRDLECLQHPIEPLVTTCTLERRPDAPIEQ